MFPASPQEGESSTHPRPRWCLVYSHWGCTACTGGRPQCRRWPRIGRAGRSSELPCGPPCHGCCLCQGCERGLKLQGSLGHWSKAAGRWRPLRPAVQNEGHCHFGTEVHAWRPGGLAGYSHGWDQMAPGTWNAGPRASPSGASVVSVRSPSAVVKCTGPSHSHTCQGRWDLGSCSYRETHKKGNEQ